MTACVDASRRASPPIPTLAEDLLGTQPSGSTAADWPAATDTEVIDSTDVGRRRRGPRAPAGGTRSAQAPAVGDGWAGRGDPPVRRVRRRRIPLLAQRVRRRQRHRLRGRTYGRWPDRRGRIRPATPGRQRAPTGTGGTATPGGGAATGGGFGGAGGATIGTVKLVDGNNVYLTDSSGATVKVTLAPNASVTVTKKGKLADLTPGTAVVVVGKTGVGRHRHTRRR